MNHKQDEIRMKFYDMAKNAMLGNRDRWLAFEMLWDKGEYRKAYLFFHEAAQILDIKFNEDSTKIDEEFYWDFIA